MTTTENWQQRKRHDTETRQALISGGEMDQVGRLRAWSGRKTLERLRAAGHTSLDHDKCACMSSGVTATPHRESRSR